MVEHFNFKNLLAEASALKVSDIHFQPTFKKVSIFFRFKTKMQLRTVISLEDYNTFKRIIKYYSKLEIAIINEPQDSSFTIDVNDVEINIRVSIIPTLENETIVLRIIFNEIISNLFIEQNSSLHDIYHTLSNNKGLYVFTGSTGSGKTTTMYAILDKLASSKKAKIITIENPIEVSIPSLVQTEINTNRNLDYDTYLKAILRQDPDYIMIGEIRDQKTAKIIIQAALTGHTIVTTMHTKSLQGVIERFLDFGFFLSEIEAVLIGITHQEMSINSTGNIDISYTSSKSDILTSIFKGFKNES